MYRGHELLHLWPGPCETSRLARLEAIRARRLGAVEVRHAEALNGRVRAEGVV